MRLKICFFFCVWLSRVGITTPHSLAFLRGSGSQAHLLDTLCTNAPSLNPKLIFFNDKDFPSNVLQVDSHFE